MKKYYVALFVLLGFYSSGQIVTLTPTFVTQNDTVTVTYDASQGNQGLIGVNTVYTHTGVITNLSSSPTDWRHVQGNWGQHDPKVQMTNIGNNKHTIKYHINSFYNVPSNETVVALAFVFRNVDGSKEGKTASGGDIFVPISQGGYNASFTSPLMKQNLVNKGDTILIKAEASSSSSMEIKMNGTTLATGSAITKLEYIFYTDSFAVGYHEFTLESSDGSNVDNDTVSILTRAGTPIAPIPSYGKEGVHVINDSTMYFQLRAPFKEFVYLIGDFNDWKYHPNYELKKSPSGDYFWIEITGLDKTTEYGFQYYIDEEGMRVTDPYVEKILDPWNDKHISNATYPNLKPYPAGKTTEIVGVFQIEGATYSWSNTPYQRPAKEELIIYELLVRDFDQNHDYNAVIDKLDYLQKMGVNAIELMPVMEFEGNESWGYNPMFMFAPDKYYGPKNELKRLVDSCHSRGMAVILDIVLNHSFGQSPMVKMYFDPNAGQWGQPTAQNPWFNEVPKHDFNVGYDFNHLSADTKRYTKEVLQHWLKEYKIDGYRLDLSKGLTQKNTLGNVGAWGQYDQSRINILKDYAQTVWSVDSTAFYILEHFADNSEETVLSNDGQMIWGNMNHEYNEATMGYSSNLYGVSHQSRSWSDMHLVGYMESHDEERLMYKNLNFGGSNANYSTKELDTALKRVGMAAAFFYTVPGPKMLWQFGELGYDYSINYCPDGSIDPDCRTYNKPIRWDYYTEPERKELYNTFAELNYLRKTYPVFSYDKQHELNVSGIRKRIKLSDSTLQVVVIGNFGITPGNIDPDFHQAGWWYDHFSKDSINVTNVNDNISLKPGEWKLYTSSKLKSTITIEEEIKKLTSTVYPNPFSDYVVFSTNTERIESVQVMDITGRIVYTTKPEGITDSIQWDGRNLNGVSLPHGVYIYTVHTLKNSFSGKLIKK